MVGKSWTPQNVNKLTPNRDFIANYVFSRQFANLYGFKNEAQMHIEKSRMAGTVETLVGVIET